MTKKQIFFACMAIFMPGWVMAQSTNYVIDSLALTILGYEGGHSVFRFNDINDDGNMDIVTVGDHGSPNVNTSQHGVTVFLGNGFGTSWSYVQDGDFGYGGVAVGDVNNDGYKDVAYGVHHNYSSTDLGDQVLEVALGNGSATGWVAWDDSLGMQGQTWGMFGTDLADINNDGLLDVGSNAFGCCDGYHVSLNNGNGTWSYAYGYVGGNSNHLFRFADFNNDGDMDFAVARQTSTSYFGNGTGNFSNKDNGLVPLGVFGYDYIDVADINGDGSEELGFCVGGGVYVYRWNNGTQQWTSLSGTLPATGGYYAMNFGDYNGDGYKDVAAFNSNTCHIYTGNGAGGWMYATGITIPYMTWPQAMASGDTDHNGQDEIVVLARFPNGLFNNINKLYLLRETTAPTSNNIYGVTPKEGQCIPNNSVRFIQWNSILLPGTPSRVNLELSIFGSGGPYTPIATNIPNNGTYQWTVPAGINSATCVIRYTVTNVGGSVTYAVATSPPFDIGCNGAVGLQENEAGNYHIYPNPSQGPLTLELKDPAAAERTFRLADARGRIIKEMVVPIGQVRMTFAKENLQKGVYLVYAPGSTNPVRWVRL